MWLFIGKRRISGRTGELKLLKRVTLSESSFKGKGGLAKFVVSHLLDTCNSWQSDVCAFEGVHKRWLTLEYYPQGRGIFYQIL